MAQKTTILNSEQTDFLKFAANFPFLAQNYYLTGGTPLSAFYLKHRLSEDLDFFIEQSEVNLISVQKLIKAAQKKFKLTKASYQNYQGLHTFFLKYPNNQELKIDFNYYPFPRIDKKRKELGIQIDSLFDIAVNKIHTVATRTNARDFIDIYFISKETNYGIADLIKWARNKFDFYIDPVQYGKQFLKVVDLKDFPKMIKPLDQKDFESFFLTEARKLKKEIFL